MLVKVEEGTYINPEMIAALAVHDKSNVVQTYFLAGSTSLSWTKTTRKEALDFCDKLVEILFPKCDL